MLPKTSSVELLEGVVKAYLGDECKEVVALSSGEVALRYALRACGVRPAFEVCVPSFVGEEVVAQVLGVDAFPVFVGSEPDTWNMSADLLEDAIDGRGAEANVKPQAVVLGAVYGMPATMHRICEVCCRRGIPLVEYSVDGLGSEFCERKLGAFGWHWYGIVSFGKGNAVECSGALLVCDGKQEKERILGIIGRDRRVRMSEACAAAALEQMSVLESRVAHQRRIHSLYSSLLEDIPGAELFSQPVYSLPYGEPPFFNSNYNRCAMLIDEDVCDVATLQRSLAAAGVKAERLYKPLHTISEYLQYTVFTDGVCEDLYKRGLVLPSGYNITETQVRLVAGVLKDILEK